MARGNPDKLIPLNKRTKQEQREIARMGGKRSGEVRREKADILKMLKAMAGDIVEDENGDEKTRAEIVAFKLWEGAQTGNMAQVKELLDRIYGKPAQTVDMQSSDGSMSPTALMPVSFEQWKKNQDE